MHSCGDSLPLNPSGPLLSLVILICKQLSPCWFKPYFALLCPLALYFLFILTGFILSVVCDVPFSPTCLCFQCSWVLFFATILFLILRICTKDTVSPSGLFEQHINVHAEIGRFQLHLQLCYLRHLQLSLVKVPLIVTHECPSLGGAISHGATPPDSQ